MARRKKVESETAEKRNPREEMPMHERTESRGHEASEKKRDNSFRSRVARLKKSGMTESPEIYAAYMASKKKGKK